MNAVAVARQPDPVRMLEPCTPGKKHQGAVHRVSDIGEYTCIDETGGVFEQEILPVYMRRAPATPHLQ